MEASTLPNDFKEFLQSLNAERVEYLLIGGYAVGYYGYPRYTADIDFWIARRQDNAERVVKALKQFGFDMPENELALFMRERSVARMGVPPMRIEITNHIDGVQFDECYARRVVDKIDGVQVSLISLDDLKTNKRAVGRLKDLADLENLP
ncbi:MAG: hypothetical protein A2W37_13250 [Chloroflexi bacterium RBG_16_63_12]|jgi:predicted nucleotidyltransferase|nr:hypothetical protein [Anaerolineales bacterium]MBM2847930.1 hypothetical protein [Anaerolineales bacterium]OGO49499.1 MAG: hypothetical protein A2W37_13250 [Chloroflexi bacterium RBG_16_63_12]